MNMFSGNSFWLLVTQADTISKLVLLLLLCLSIICWAIFIGKLALLYAKERQFKAINKKILKVKNIADLTDLATATSKTAPGYFIAKNLSFAKELTQTTSTQQINVVEWELLEKNMDNTIEALSLHNEEYISVLSSCAAVGPLVGLFGTVWGLIHSFMSISEAQVADIATIAPGMAEALITTLAGLIVAIPALVMFNYLHTKTRTLEHSLIVLADRVIFILQQLRER